MLSAVSGYTSAGNLIVAVRIWQAVALTDQHSISDAIHCLAMCYMANPFFVFG
jgi:hypothetical protein